ncbi:unnamed protein product [Prorocentrum cordatum]|uniref:Uncharacterized protein n=1 Tax=Prorocentrum cordatum TaxID=2364126 RepID=A0ABN9QIA5_9DINO|nr:unnamed protein product [Polarella glacialis]
MPEPVPLLVHQTAPRDRGRWDPHWEPCQATWRAACPEPGHQHLLWDDGGLRALVAEAFPEHLAVYDGYERHIQRVDFARAAMLDWRTCTGACMLTWMLRPAGHPSRTSQPAW